MMKGAANRRPVVSQERVLAQPFPRALVRLPKPTDRQGAVKRPRGRGGDLLTGGLDADSVAATRPRDRYEARSMSSRFRACLLRTALELVSIASRSSQRNGDG